jgi:hypothetical protein
MCILLLTFLVINLFCQFFQNLLKQIVCLRLIQNILWSNISWKLELRLIIIGFTTRIHSVTLFFTNNTAS